MEYIRIAVFHSFCLTLMMLLCLILFILINKKKRGKDKEVKFFVYLFSVSLVLSFLFIGYTSLDLVYEDFETDIGTYLYTHRKGSKYNAYFDTGEKKHPSCSIYRDDQLNGVELIEGNMYKFTRAKRTNVLIDIEEITNFENSYLPID